MYVEIQLVDTWASWWISQHDKLRLNILSHTFLEVYSHDSSAEPRSRQVLDPILRFRKHNLF